MRLVVLLIAGGLLVFGDARQELLDADVAFAKSTAERGLDGWMSWFAEDAQLNTRQGIVKGSAALRQFYSRMFAQPAFSIKWKPTYAEASNDGTLGYTFGEAVIESRDEKGEIQKRDGRYVTIWRKQTDGSWKVATDLGN